MVSVIRGPCFLIFILFKLVLSTKLDGGDILQHDLSSSLAEVDNGDELISDLRFLSSSSSSSSFLYPSSSSSSSSSSSPFSSSSSSSLLSSSLTDAWSSSSSSLSHLLSSSYNKNKNNNNNNHIKNNKNKFNSVGVPHARAMTMTKHSTMNRKQSASFIESVSSSPRSPIESCHSTTPVKIVSVVNSSSSPFSSSSPSFNYASSSSSSSPFITSSPLDRRVYRSLTLSNGASILLASDPSAQRSGASVDVGAGSASDPVNIPGLAHFLEHVLFLGTEAYPDEDAYFGYIALHGGDSNAYTAYQNTNFFFNIQADKFTDALERFAQFFTCPLFLSSSLSREEHAVDSEHVKNLQSDEYRLDRLLHSLSSPDNSFHKFGTGNLMIFDEVGTQKMREAAIAHFREHYTADNMRIVLTGRETLDELEAVALRVFKNLPVRDSALPKRAPTDNLTPTVPLFPPFIYGSKITVVPVHNTPLLVLTFQLPSQSTRTPLQYRSHSLDYVLMLLNSKDDSSVSQKMRASGLVSECAAFVVETTVLWTLVQVEISLTENGVKGYADVLALFYSYVRFLQQQDQSVKRARYLELSRLSSLEFTFSDEEAAAEFSSTTASTMNVMYDVKDVMTAPMLFERYDEEEVDMLLNKLATTNQAITFVVIPVTPDASFLQEQYYGVRYKIGRFSASDQLLFDSGSGLSSELVALTQQFKLPGANPYIPSDDDLALVDASLDHVHKYVSHAYEPLLISEVVLPHSRRVFFSFDSSFRRPISHFVVRIWSPLVQSSATSFLLTSLYVILSQQSMSSVLYFDNDASYHLAVLPNRLGLTIVASGWTAGLDEFVLRAMKVFVTKLKMTQAEFLTVKASVMNQLMQIPLSAPYQWSMILSNLFFNESPFTPIELLTALFPLQLSDLTAWSHILFSDVAIEILCSGNLLSKQCLSLADTIEQQLPYKSSSMSFYSNPARIAAVNWPRYTALSSSFTSESRFSSALSSSLSYMLITPNPDPADLNSASVLTFQFGVGSRLSSLCTQLLSLLAERHVFQELRTKEQLGYIVGAKGVTDGFYSSFKVVVQSSIANSTYLLNRELREVGLLIDSILAYDIDTFTEWRNTLIKLKQEQPRTLGQLTILTAGPIFSQTYDFSSRLRDIELLNSFSASKLQLIFHRYLSLLFSPRFGSHFEATLVESQSSARSNVKERLHDIAQSLGFIQKDQREDETIMNEADNEHSDEHDELTSLLRLSPSELSSMSESSSPSSTRPADADTDVSRFDSPIVAFSIDPFSSPLSFSPFSKFSLSQLPVFRKSNFGQLPSHPTGSAPKPIPGAMQQVSKEDLLHTFGVDKK